jgi:glycosyltransferase involved in cell wall biosynthesis
MSSEFVSIVLVTYNRCRALPSTIETILSQSYESFELLIQDDASHDGTREVCEEYARWDSRIRYVRNPENLGMPGNMNLGIRSSKGEYVAVLHDGDFYDRSLIYRWKRALDKHPKAAFVFNAYAHLNPDGDVDVVKRCPISECVSGHDLLEKVFFADWHLWSPVWGTVMARRSAYEAAGYFESRFGFYSDVDMWMRLAENWDVAYIDEPLIALPSPKVLKHEFPLSHWKSHRLVTRIFREAVCRHYAGDTRRLARALCRHYCYSLASSTYLGALVCRRNFLDRAARIPERLSLKRAEKSLEVK